MCFGIGGAFGLLLGSFYFDSSVMVRSNLGACSAQSLIWMGSSTTLFPENYRSFNRHFMPFDICHSICLALSLAMI